MEAGGLVWFEKFAGVWWNRLGDNTKFGFTFGVSHKFLGLHDFGFCLPVFVYWMVLLNEI